MSAKSRVPLWTCPKCGAKLVTRNMWHSCGEATLADWKARMGPRARPLAWLRDTYRLMGMQGRLNRR